MTIRKSLSIRLKANSQRLTATGCPVGAAICRPPKRGAFSYIFPRSARIIITYYLLLLTYYFKYLPPGERVSVPRKTSAFTRIIITSYVLPLTYYLKKSPQIGFTNLRGKQQCKNDNTQVAVNRANS